MAKLKIEIEFENHLSLEDAQVVARRALKAMALRESLTLESFCVSICELNIKDRPVHLVEASLPMHQNDEGFIRLIG